MIVTLTANPSLDRTVELTGPLERGRVHRTERSTVDPGGKGINVARVLHSAGSDVLAVLPANVGDPLIAALGGQGIAYRAVPTSGPTRNNITIAEPDGTTTKLNEPGTPCTGRALGELHAALLECAQDAAWTVLSGSLPPGIPESWYADLVGALRSLGCRVAVDTSEGPLLALAERFPEAAPDVVKPNSDELAQLTGTDAGELEAGAAAGDVTAVVEAGRVLVGRGVGTVLATLGSAGAVLVTDAGAWRATSAEVTVRSTVGAGDSSLAGYLLAEQTGLEPPERLRLAVAYGTAAVALPGTALPTPDSVDPSHVHVTDIHPRPRALPTHS
ncbi:1-phosphofructokinase family hexose kinase [Rhodococcus sp. NPDC047139]|uniref:1-phosphofructokinase family hexose kinase n=1 Tax=Rhodococcus sp. NPDC047139 TaxID=3155141 RepID=UPI0033DADB7F